MRKFITIILFTLLFPITVHAAPIETENINKVCHKLDVSAKSLKEVDDAEIFDEVPLYDQGDYKKTPYGKYGTIASHGCGITCLSMITSYFKDKEVLPDVLAKQFGNYNTEEGSYWSLFEDSAEELDLPFQERTYDWDKVYEALKNGQLVVSLQKKKSIFTNSGHFVLLTGVSEEGLIFVNDPNGKNYEKESLKDGFENGFTVNHIRKGEVVYWIYSAKEYGDETKTEVSQTSILV